MSVIAAQYPISCAERVPKTLHFVWNLRVVLGRNDTRLIICGSQMLSKAPIINIVYLKKGYATLKQQWMSCFTAHHLISCAERVPEIWYFAWNLRVVFGRNDTRVDHEGLKDPPWRSFMHYYTSKEDYESLKQQRMYLIIAQHPISCAERVPKIWYFCLKSDLAEMT